MNGMQRLIEKTLLYHFWSELRLRYYFKYVLPRMTTATVSGIRLDLGRLSPKARNRIVNVGYETQECELCRRYLSRDDAVLELGGAIGFIGLYCQKIIGIENYTIVEANPGTIEILQRNFALNGIEPKVWNYAVAAERGEIDLNTGNEFWENSVVAESARYCGGSVRVPAAPIDDLLALAGPVNALVADIEGAERFIDFAALPERVNKVIVELHPSLIGAGETYRIVADLIHAGFRVANESNYTFAFLKERSPADERSRRPAGERAGRQAAAVA